MLRCCDAADDDDDDDDDGDDDDDDDDDGDGDGDAYVDSDWNCIAAPGGFMLAGRGKV